MPILLTRIMDLVQLASVRMLPWARSNLNHTAQALIISTGSCLTIVDTSDLLFSSTNLTEKGETKKN